MLCAICLENIDLDNNNIYTIPECNHTFHMKCALEWYRRVDNEASCPLCRSISSDYMYDSIDMRLKLYKKISRRKNCPILIKNICKKIAKNNIKYIQNRKNSHQYRQKYKDILAIGNKLQRQQRVLVDKKYQLERDLDNIPHGILLREIIRN